MVACDERVLVVLGDALDTNSILLNGPHNASPDLVLTTYLGSNRRIRQGQI